MPDMTQEEFEATLKEKYEVVGAVQLRKGVTAYFRRATQQEYDTLQVLAVDGDGAKNIAFARYVKACFIGAWPSCTLEEIIAIEGPGIIGGPCGKLVNSISGSLDRPTREL